MENALQFLKSALHEELKKSESYHSWGRVEVLELLVFHQNEYFVFNADEGDEFRKFEFLSETHPIFSKLAKKKKPGVILISRQTNASRVIAQHPSEVPPILDDQAQLLGVSIRLVTPTDILKGLSGRYSTLLTNNTAVSIGNTLEDAFVAAFLVEKTCKAYVEAQAIGGAKPINRIEAWLMHKFYMLKYSKESERNK